MDDLLHPNTDGTWTLAGGLVDAHLHLAIDMEGIGLPRTDLVRRHREALLAAGVLAARDLGSPPDGPGLLDLPRDRFRVASRLLGPPGRSYPHLCVHVDDDGLEDAAAQVVAAGADWVKVMWDFPGPDGDWLASPRNYEPATLRRVCDAAHEAGARVSVHTIGPDTHAAVEAGVDTVEHGGVLGRATLELMASRGIAWVPTLFAAHRHLDPLRELGPGPAGAVDRLFAAVEEQLATARELGVPVLAGSDETMPGELWREVALLHEHGLTPAEAIGSASAAARAVLRLPVPAGDGVTYAADPRGDLAALGRPVSVTVGGMPAATGA